MARFIDSDYVEISGPHKSDIRRELVNVYRGRFCFKLGAGVRCGAETKFTIGSGEKRKLELSFGAGIPVPGAPGFGASGGSSTSTPSRRRSGRGRSIRATASSQSYASRMLKSSGSARAA
jgi:hypothetical protein